ncbi:hypothetical protein DYP60_07140 [Sphaerochaeta halotolerans]|uniref:Uncharacterized protein n=1 Tax=Sphaerochaeta halotolerans TaxID=2293840 RepID=A0A372MII5_9SPIR|nr:hypothetical protein [Sphaerochaeta halotolerans]RFU94990.1 hypothetical protein DYP60_07140 [Sphaerochaeta halotolerans]
MKRFLSLEEVLVSVVHTPRCHLQGLGVDLAKPGVDFLENTFDSPTEREERNQHDGSSHKRVPGKEATPPESRACPEVLIPFIANQKNV